MASIVGPWAYSQVGRYSCNVLEGYDGEYCGGAVPSTIHGTTQTRPRQYRVYCTHGGTHQHLTRPVTPALVLRFAAFVGTTTNHQVEVSSGHSWPEHRVQCSHANATRMCFMLFHSFFCCWILNLVYRRIDVPFNFLGPGGICRTKCTGRR